MMIHSFIQNDLSIITCHAAETGFLRIAFTVAVCTVAVLAGIFVTVYLIGLLYRRYRRSLRVDQWLQIENQGNTDSVFQLRPDAGTQKVWSAVYFQDRPLDFALQEISEPEKKSAKVNQQPVPTKQVNNQPDPATRDVQLQGTKENVVSASKEVKKKALGGVNIGRKLGGIVGALGSLLPGDAGKTFKDQSTRIQGATQKAAQTIEEPEQKKEELEHIQREMKGLTGKKTASSGSLPVESPAPVKPATVHPASSSNSSTAQDEDRSAASPAGSNARRYFPRKGVFQTPFIKAGEKLRLKLVLSPADIFRTVSIPLCIESTQMIKTDEGGLKKVNSSETWQTFQVEGLPVSKMIVHILLGLLIAAVNILWVTLVIRWFIGSYV